VACFGSSRLIFQRTIVRPSLSAYIIKSLCYYCSCVGRREGRWGALHGNEALNEGAHYLFSLRSTFEIDAPNMFWRPRLITQDHQAHGRPVDPHLWPRRQAEVLARHDSRSAIDMLSTSSQCVKQMQVLRRKTPPSAVSKSGVLRSQGPNVRSSKASALQPISRDFSLIHTKAHRVHTEDQSAIERMCVCKTARKSLKKAGYCVFRTNPFEI
jgi:hypothetical protein